MKSNKFVTNGGRRTEWINSNNEFHKENEPAVVDLDENLEEWYIDGKPYRKDGPWKIEEGVEWWCTRNPKNLLFGNSLHRLDGPAKIFPKNHTLYKNGREEWYKEDRLHNENGPAINEPGNQPEKRWYLEGASYAFDKYLFLIEYNYGVSKEKIVKMKLEYGK